MLSLLSSTSRSVEMQLAAEDEGAAMLQLMCLPARMWSHEPMSLSLLGQLLGSGHWRAQAQLTPPPSIRPALCGQDEQARPEHDREALAGVPVPRVRAVLRGEEGRQPSPIESGGPCVYPLCPIPSKLS